MPSNKKKRSKKKQKSSAKKRQGTTSVATKDTDLDTTLISQLRSITDEELFGKDIQCYLGECPVCMLALSPDEFQRVFMSCCMTKICNGCFVASALSDMKAGRNKLCFFCRAPIPFEGPDGNKETLAQLQRRADAGDADAHYALGQWYDSGERGLLRNRKRAIALWEEAAKLGSVEAHIHLGYAHEEGDGVKRDTTKALYHFQVAAIGGHFRARHNLGAIEYNEGRMESALKHWMISSKMGWENSLKGIQAMYVGGHAAKDDYAQALLGYQDATEEIQSAQRAEADEFYRNEETNVARERVHSAIRDEPPHEFRLRMNT